ncbi:hypothetical protein ALPO108162_02185 [Alicyclobacillus pomorum]|jgi:hypothetical protein
MPLSHKPPNVRRTGDRSGVILSCIQERRLPSGWNVDSAFKAPDVHRYQLLFVCDQVVYVD